MPCRRTGERDPASRGIRDAWEAFILTIKGRSEKLWFQGYAGRNPAFPVEGGE
jgi:hypothetical protein